MLHYGARENKSLHHKGNVVKEAILWLTSTRRLDNPAVSLTTLGNGSFQEKKHHVLIEVFFFRDMVNFSTLIYHNLNTTPYNGPISLAEAWPEAAIRIVYPKYLAVQNQSFSSNYTTGKLLFNLTGNGMVVRFLSGILFTDIIQFNFSLQLNPLNGQVRQLLRVKMVLRVFP